VVKIVLKRVRTSIRTAQTYLWRDIFYF